MTEFRSPLFALAHEIVERHAALSPMYATSHGIAGFDHLLDDFSPAAQRAKADADRGFLAQLQALTPIDDVDRLAAAVIQDRLASSLSLHESGESARSFSVISSPVGDIRENLDIMSTDGPDALENIRLRLLAVPASLASWRECLVTVRDANALPALRHIDGVAEQADTTANGALEAFVTSAAGGTANEGLLAAARIAQTSFAELATWMRAELSPHAAPHEGVGLDRYAPWARRYTGAQLDFEELYEWGHRDLQRINARMWEIARTVAPDATTLQEVAHVLDNDPKQLIHGEEAMVARLKQIVEEATVALDGTHFEIDPRVRFCDVRIAPPGSGGAAYYISPSEDLSRPGTSWFPTLGATSFPLWREVSTWYHEAIPGHHLENATAIVSIDRQSRFHRLEGWMSGYGEGWALYAERFMDELGFFSNPADELGYLSNNGLRAARVVVDIGAHLGLPVPQDFGVLKDFGDVGGKAWTPEMMVAVLEERAMLDHAMAVTEVDRYLGWPAQAISYKVGERVWLRARESARTIAGDRFDLKAFHTYALKNGPLGLDLFEAEMKRWAESLA